MEADEKAARVIASWLAHPGRANSSDQYSAQDILVKLAEAGLVVVAVADLPARHCLRCKKDLTDVMGCYVFVGGKPVDGLLCVEHGANGANGLSSDEYERLTGKEI